MGAFYKLDTNQIEYEYLHPFLMPFILMFFLGNSGIFFAKKVF